MSRYQVLVIDLDGTLLSPDGTISAANARAVEDARAAGLEVVIATGRSLVESEHALDAIGHAGLVVTAGGSMLTHVASRRTLVRRTLAHDVVEEVARVVLRHEHKVLLLKDPGAAGYDYLAVGEAELDPASEWWFRTLPVRVEHVDTLEEDPHPHDTVRAGAVAPADELAPIARRLTAALGDRAFLQHWAAVTQTEATGSDTHLLEVFGRDVNKWTTIAAYCAESGIDTGAVAAIGDGVNDVELVREAGLGVAMGNADERVLREADRVTDDYASDGVAKAVRLILDGSW
jgi:hypothetical protein